LVIERTHMLDHRIGVCEVERAVCHGESTPIGLNVGHGSIEIEGSCANIEDGETAGPEVLPCRSFPTDVKNGLAVTELVDKPLHAAFAKAGPKETIELSRKSHA